MRGDKLTDELYGSMRERFGARSARANGYRYEAYFLREQATLLSLMDRSAAIVVDVACGSGLMLKPLLDPQRTVCGVEFNTDACEAALANGFPVIRGDAYALPLAAASVDEVVNCQFFNQQPPAAVDAFIREVARVLVPGGRLIMVWRNAGAVVHRLAHAILSAADDLRGLPRFPQMAHTFSEVRRYATAAGLETVHEEVTCAPLAWRSRQVHGWLARCIGASCVMVARKPQRT